MSFKEGLVYLFRMARYSNLRIVFAGLLPNIASYIFMAFVLYVNVDILGEACLSIIGIEPTKGVTLGLILQ